MGSFELSDRSTRLLATLVREYIESGEPVPSQVLARKSGLGVSSATVRNVLAQLEDLGYVHQPHTSAGRVPTDRGYRVLVDRLWPRGNLAGAGAPRRVGGGSSRRPPSCRDGSATIPIASRSSGVATAASSPSTSRSCRSSASVRRMER